MGRFVFENFIEKFVPKRAETRQQLSKWENKTQFKDECAPGENLVLKKIGIKMV
jgi:hypothetical protein